MKAKFQTAKKLPVSIVTVSFDYDENIALLVRAAACYGAQEVLVIGALPPRRYLRPKSGSTLDFVKVKTFPNPRDFLMHCKDNDIKIVSSEFCDDSVSLFNYKFDTSAHTAIVIGNETTGVPVDILVNGDVTHIPMPGVGFCLNASQAGTAVLNEYTRQYFAKD